MLNTMDNKNLKNKAVKIQGKDYVLVADRIIYFNENYPTGSITTQLVSAPQDQTIIIQAVVTPDIEKQHRIFTGYSQAVIGQGYINKTSALENAETSAVGRALAMMGIGVIESVASVDEINKAQQASAPKPLPPKPVQSWSKPHVQATTAKAYGAQKVTYTKSDDSLDDIPFTN